MVSPSQVSVVGYLRLECGGLRGKNLDIASAMPEELIYEGRSWITALSTLELFLMLLSDPYHV